VESPRTQLRWRGEARAGTETGAAPAAAPPSARAAETPGAEEESDAGCSRPAPAAAAPAPAADRGGDGNDVETLKLLRTGTRGLVLDAVHQTVPAPERSALDRALRDVPRLVEIESDPARFLRCCLSGRRTKMDGGRCYPASTQYPRDEVEAAARKLATFWSERLELFGEDRAFLPLNQTGRGALSREDVQVLGVKVLFLPATTT